MYKMKQRQIDLAKAKLLGEASCRDCQFLYEQDVGYSNYTVSDTNVHCALDRNPNLPADMPGDWRHVVLYGADNWPATKDSRCLRFDPLPMNADRPRFSVECHAGDDEVKDELRLHHRHARKAIVEHAGYAKKSDT